MIVCSDAYKEISIFVINIFPVLDYHLLPHLVLVLSTSFIASQKELRVRYLWFRVSANDNLHCTRIAVA